MLDLLNTLPKKFGKVWTDGENYGFANEIVVTYLEKDKEGKKNPVPRPEIQAQAIQYLVEANGWKSAEKVSVKRLTTNQDLLVIKIDGGDHGEPVVSPVKGVPKSPNPKPPKEKFQIQLNELTIVVSPQLNLVVSTLLKGVPIVRTAGFGLIRYSNIIRPPKIVK